MGLDGTERNGVLVFEMNKGGRDNVHKPTIFMRDVVAEAISGSEREREGER